MPAFCARWPDGSFSIVDADDETHALIQLDELGDEPAELWQLASCLLDFELTERGTFRIRQFGEQTGPEIMERAYPVLSKALEAEAFAEHGMEGQGETLRYGSEETEVLRKAVEAERERLMDSQRTSATTEQGKSLQRELGASGAYIDVIVEQAASARLKRYRPGKNVKLSLCKLFGVKLCTLFGVGPCQQARDGGGMDFEEPRRIGGPSCRPLKPSS